MPLTDFEQRVTAAVESVGPSVAGIQSLHVERRRMGLPYGAAGRATAVVIGREGYLVTNEHVVEGATQIRVQLPDGRDLEGEAVGGDEATDVAIVKVDGIEVVPARLGSSRTSASDSWSSPWATPSDCRGGRRFRPGS